MEGVIFGLSLLFIIIIFDKTFTLYTERNYYIDELDNCKRENERLMLRIKAYKINESYQKYMYKNKEKNIHNNDIKEAVKYAMKKSHPDNGGSSDEFNKFRELYNKIK